MPPVSTDDPVASAAVLTAVLHAAVTYSARRSGVINKDLVVGHGYQAVSTGFGEQREIFNGFMLHMIRDYDPRHWNRFPYWGQEVFGFDTGPPPAGWFSKHIKATVAGVEKQVLITPDAMYAEWRLVGGDHPHLPFWLRIRENTDRIPVEAALVMAIERARAW
jgi:hypothetical protein